MTVDDGQDVVECRSYTHARRHPQVIGRIGGWSLPTPITPAQLLVLVGMFVVLVETRGLWSRVTGDADLLVLALLPMAGAWTIRHVQPEGRSPIRTLCGVAAVVRAPSGGTARGRAQSQMTGRRVAGRPVLFVDSRRGR